MNLKRVRESVLPEALPRLRRPNMPLEENVRTPTRSDPDISLEEVDRDEVIVRISAAPLSESDGPQLADEVLAAIGAVTRIEDEDDAFAEDERRRSFDPGTQEFES